MVADKKAWRYGPNDAGKQCAAAAQSTFLQSSATEPYLPPDCEGIFIRGLTAKDFHLLVDGKEQKISSVTSASDGLRVRDNLGWHIDHSQTPAGIWSSTDSSEPASGRRGIDYGFLARNRYDISFAPGGPNGVGCHSIRIKVDRPNTIVAAREEYCASESPSDVLNGSTFGKLLEQDLDSGQPGEIPIALEAATFEGERENRVHIALKFPPELLFREWSEDWKERATIGVLGIIYRHDGSVASRFSDFACCEKYSSGTVFGTGLMSMNSMGSELASKVVRPAEMASIPSRYQTRLDLPPGEYSLRIVLSDGKKFGRAEAHLKVENYGGAELALSSVMLSKRYRDAHVAEVERKAAGFAPQYVPLVSKGVQFTPAGDTSFASTEKLIAYFQIYAPHNSAGLERGIKAHIRIVDTKSGASVKEYPPVEAATYKQSGSSVVPVAREVPIQELPKGEYRLEIQASDSFGHRTSWQAATFSIR